MAESRSKFQRDFLTYQSAIVLIPPEEAWPAIQAIRQKYDRKMRRWMPHITLVYPFWDHSRFDEAIERLRPICAHASPFEVTLAEFRTFDHGRQRFTIWLAPRPKEPIVALYRQLVTTLGLTVKRRQHPSEFTPHLSVGQVQGTNERARLLSQLTQEWCPVTFTIGQIHLIWRNLPPDDIFRVQKSVPLGN